MEQTAPIIDVASPKRVVHPYAPSWIDRLTAWVDRLPGPAWLYYLAALTFGCIVYYVVKWWEGGFPVVIPKFILLTNISAFIYLGAIHYLDKFARNAMTQFRAVIEAPDVRIAELDYQLTTMPARAVWIVTLLGILGAVLLLVGVVSGVVIYPDMDFFTALSIAILEFMVTVLVFVVFVICAYHTFHQMRTVNIIYTELSKIDLFNQGPLHAFARLAAYTGIALMIPQYLWFSAGLRGGAFGVSVALLSIALALVVITFTWPVYGIHRLLTTKKAQLQGEASRRLEKSLLLFAQAMDKEDLAMMDTIGAAMRNAEHERQLVAATSTWPWPPGLLRGAITAIVLPLLIWAATRILEQFLGA